MLFLRRFVSCSYRKRSHRAGTIWAEKSCGRLVVCRACGLRDTARVILAGALNKNLHGHSHCNNSAPTLHTHCTCEIMQGPNPPTLCTHAAGNSRAVLGGTLGNEVKVSVLRCAMPCYVVPCHAALCRVVLCCVVLCCTAMFRSVLCCTCCAVLYC